MVCCNAGEDYIRLLNDSITDNGVKDVAKDVVKELSDIDMQLLKEPENNPYIQRCMAFTDHTDNEQTGEPVCFIIKYLNRHRSDYPAPGILAAAQQLQKAFFLQFFDY